MTTAPAKDTNLPAFMTTRHYVQSLPPQEAVKHRVWIGVRIEALLDGYWNSRPSDAVRVQIVSDWMDALQDFAPEEIDAACKAYLRGPDRARKPKTGDIVDLMVAARTELRRAMTRPEPPKPMPSPDPEAVEERRRKAEEIMARFRSDRA